MTGLLAGCGAGWCVEGVTLDVGPAAQLGAIAAQDYDGDGVLETNTLELTGLTGTEVVLKVATDGAPAAVYVVNGLGYRNADGSFA